MHLAARDDLFTHDGPLAGLDDPGKGDFAEILRCGDGFAEQAQTYRAMAENIRGAGALFDANVSRATAALAGTASLLGERLGTAAATFEGYRATYVAYAVSVEAISSECARLRAMVEAELADIRSHARTINGALGGAALSDWTFRWNVIPDSPGAVANAVGESSGDSTSGINAADVTTVERARAAWRDCLARLATIRQLWQLQIDARTRADEAAVRGLDDLPIFAAAGVPRTGPPGSRLEADTSDLLRAWATLDGAAFENAYGTDADRALAALGTMGVAQVAGIWAGLSPAFRMRLADRDPERVGTFAGASPLDRDYANVKRLQGLYDAAAQRYRELAGRDGPRSYDGDPGMADAAASLKAFRLLLNRYGDGRRRKLNPPEYLTTLDVSGSEQPLVAVSVGDISRAANVSYFVPGMNSSIAELPDYARAAERLRDGKDDAAVVLWLNYVSPGPTEVPTNDRARDGAARLAADVSEQAAASGAIRLVPRTTVIGHSYGSTLVSLALAQEPLGVDSAVMVGSAGIPDDLTAPDLHVLTEQLFVSQADKDWLATFGQKTSGRANPEDPSWGGTLFGVDGTVLPDGTVLEPVEGHNAVGGSATDDQRKYFGAGTESLRNIQRILRDESVTEGMRNDPHLRLVHDR